MCLKGPVLAQQLYGGLQCRQFGDLDILVRPDDIVIAAETLNGLGYHETSCPIALLSSSKRKRMQRLFRHVVFVNRRGPRVVVELHWWLAGRCDALSQSPEWLEGNGPCGFGGSRFRVLPPVKRILFLAWHGSLHRWERLSWLFDLAWAVRAREQRDCKDLFDAASRAGVAKHLALGLSLLRQLMETDSASDRLATPFDQSLWLRRATELSLAAVTANAGPRTKRPLDALVWKWRLCATSGSRLDALCRAFAPRMDHIHLSAPFFYGSRLRLVAERKRTPGLLADDPIDSFISRSMPPPA